MVMQIALKETRLGLRNSQTRIPFRYGGACLTRCPQAVLCAQVDCNGRRTSGYSGDCLPPGWFDKSADKSYEQQIDGMLAVIACAEKTFCEEMAQPTRFFPAWQIAHERVYSRAREWGLNDLLAGFGVSMVERAVMDAMCRAVDLSFFAAVQENIFSIVPEDVHPELAGARPRDWLPSSPATSIFVRHTVGLSDPLIDAEISGEDRAGDGLPQSLESYIDAAGIRFFKVKVSNRLDCDLDRLEQFVSVVESRLGSDYALTLDGNEQYKSAEEFQRFVEAVEATPRLAALWRNTLAVEQPLDRGIVLDAESIGGIKKLAARKPVIIDESDGRLDSFRSARELGYRGVSSKNCKGPIKSLLNAGLIWHWNRSGKATDFFMTGEDLCCVGIVPVQADLCLVAALGLTHVERNGHHYHPGLSYLPGPVQAAALSTHADFYGGENGIIGPSVRDGKFHIDSLQCPGFGFEVLPNMEDYVPADEWRFASLGL